MPVWSALGYIVGGVLVLGMLYGVMVLVGVPFVAASEAIRDWWERRNHA